MTHLDNLGELAHKTKQEERIIVNKVSVTVNKAVLSEHTHCNSLVVLGGGKVLAEGLEGGFAEIADIQGLFIELSTFYDDTVNATLRILLAEFGEVLVDGLLKGLRDQILFEGFVFFHNFTC